MWSNIWRGAVLDALAREHQVRRVGHALHAAGHHHVALPAASMSCANIIARMPLPHILLSVTAPAAVGRPALQHRLARRGLALAGHQAVAHQHLVDRVAGHAGALDRGADGHRAQFPGGQAGKVAQQAADGRAGSGHDDDGVGHGHGGSWVSVGERVWKERGGAFRARSSAALTATAAGAALVAEALGGS
jgi:hypothetical protein